MSIMEFLGNAWTVEPWVIIFAGALVGLYALMPGKKRGGRQALFAGGLALTASHIDDDQNIISVWLTWRFDAPRGENDIRFVHVVDAEGSLVAQADDPLGVQPAGGGWSEAAALTLPTDLPPGEYHVYTGWYAYPDTTPFPILSDVPNADTGRLDIGTFSIE